MFPGIPSSARPLAPPRWRGHDRGDRRDTCLLPLAAPWASHGRCAANAVRPRWSRSFAIAESYER